jgi:hypothetical protein
MRLKETEFDGMHPDFAGWAVFYIIMKKSKEG